MGWAQTRLQHQKASWCWFADAEGFDWKTALVVYDGWHDDEDRWIAIGFIGIMIYVMVYSERGDTISIIRLRKATINEEKYYVKNS